MVTRSDATVGRTPSAGEPTDPFQAKLLESAVEPLHEGERRVLLDLGPPRSETVEYFSAFRCRLGIGGLTPVLEVIDAEEDADARKRLLAEQLPVELFGDTELVLCWDLLNYLQPHTITALMAHLGPLLAPGGLVHALVAYRSATMPDPIRPTVMLPDGQVARAGRHDGGTRPAPRYSTGELTRVMPGFRVERAMLLRNGIQEYLFSRNARPA